MHTKALGITGALAIAFIAAACGGDASEVGMGTEMNPRTIEVTALDEPAFDPESIEVGAGETVRFVVTNAGENEHEFVVGDEEMQEMAAAGGMEEMDDHGGAVASLSLEPGQTAEATITISEPGELLYACHVDDHYETGMVGTISVG